MIDFFLTTVGLHITKSRYTRSGGGVSKDHCAQWIEITYASALGVSVPKVIHSTINRINFQDPGVVKLFNHNYSNNLLQEQVLQLLNMLHKSIIPGNKLTEQQQAIYEIINKKKLGQQQKSKRKAGNYISVEFPLAVK